MLRDVYVHAIWEGTGNVIALDVLRALEHGALPGFVADTERLAESASNEGPAAPLGTMLLAALRELVADIGALPDDPAARQLPLRRMGRRMAMLATGARLAEEGNACAADTGSGRLAWIAARYLSRLTSEPAQRAFDDDAAWLVHADAVLHGGHVPLDFAAHAATTVAALPRVAKVA